LTLVVIVASSSASPTSRPVASAGPGDLAELDGVVAWDSAEGAVGVATLGGLGATFGGGAVWLHPEAANMSARTAPATAGLEIIGRFPSLRE
jgi:hypothetical protein